jgi:two-component system sensor histidine kinase HydH
LITFVGFGACLRLLWRAHASTDQQALRPRLRYLGVLLAGAAGTSALELVARALAGPPPPGTGLFAAAALPGTLPPFGAILALLFFYFLYLIHQLYRLVDLAEIAARLFVLGALSAGLAGLWGLLALLPGDPSQDPLHGAFLLFLASGGFLSVHDPLKGWVERRAAAWLNPPGHRLEQALQEAEQGLPRVISLEGLGDELLERLLASGRAPLVSLYLWDQAKGVYTLRLSRGPVERSLVRGIGPGAFVEALRGGGRTLSREAAPGVRERTMRAMEADLCVPVRAGDIVLGWLNLKSDPWSEGFSQEELRRIAEVVDRAAVIIENITSFRALEEQHRLAALGALSAGLAHEIRNPLAGIKGAAQYLRSTAQDGSPDPTEVEDFVGVIIDETDRLAGVVTQFLDYARPYNLELAPTDLQALCDRILELFRQGGLPTGVSLHLRTEPDLPLVQADGDKLRQVVWNLVRNAVDALPPTGGKVELRLQRARLGGPRETSALELQIIDDGVGIPTGDDARVFQPFFTTKAKGTGLGLPISRRIVEAHGGEILVRSRPGRGTTFRIRLPLSIEEDTHLEELREGKPEKVPPENGGGLENRPSGPTPD